jgi:hypothetical protein
VRVSLLLGLWAVWAAVNAGSLREAWRQFANRWAAGQLFVPTAGGVARAVAGHVLLALAAAAFAAAWGQAGRALLRFVLRGRPGWPVALLLGFAASGAWALGLALAGLFYAPVLAVLPVVAAVPGAAGLARGLRGRLRPPPVPVAAAAALAAALPSVAAMLVPEVSGDPYTCHLAAPAQFLLVHRLTPLGTSLALQYPMTAEFNYAIPAAAGLDALPHLLQGCVLAAALALLVRWAWTRAGPAAGWMTLAGILTFAITGEQMGVAKSDLAAAAYAAAGAVVFLEARADARPGVLCLSGLLFGCGAATKLNGFAVAAAAFACVLASVGGGRRAVGWALGALVPVLPWTLKNWALFGDPLWPALSARLPGALWDAESARALAIMRGDAEMTLLRWLGQPGWFPLWLVELSPAVALAFPLVLVFGFRAPAAERWMLGLALAVFAAVSIAVPFEVQRLSLAAWWLWIAGSAVVVARAATRWPAGARRLAAAGAVVLVWLPLPQIWLTYADPGAVIGVITGGMAPHAFVARTLTTYGTMAEAVGRLPGPRRVIMVGDVRLYRIPARVITERFPGRSWPWAAARECASAARLAVRMRQAGCRVLVDNFPFEAYPHPYVAAFAWDDRSLSVWRDFVGRYLAVAAWPPSTDGGNGGFVIYRLLDVPRFSPPPWLPFLPGIQSLLFPIGQAGMTGHAKDAYAMAVQLERRLPGIDILAEGAGRLALVGGRLEEAVRFLRPGVLHGSVGQDNDRMLAEALRKLGRAGEATALLRRLAGSQPHARGQIELALDDIARASGGP